jgi:hypothetical protein
LKVFVNLPMSVFRKRTGRRFILLSAEGCGFSNEKKHNSNEYLGGKWDISTCDSVKTASRMILLGDITEHSGPHKTNPSRYSMFPGMEVCWTVLHYPVSAEAFLSGPCPGRSDPRNRNAGQTPLTIAGNGPAESLRWGKMNEISSPVCREECRPSDRVCAFQPCSMLLFPGPGRVDRGAFLAELRRSSRCC